MEPIDPARPRVSRRAVLRAAATVAVAPGVASVVTQPRSASARVGRQGTPGAGSQDGVAGFDRLSERVREGMARLGVPGVGVGVIHGGEEHVAGFGVTNVEHPLPVDGDTLFQIGSTTKTVTATALMRLVEAGELDLEAPVRASLPDLRLAEEAVAARVTLRHLVTHTGGWWGDSFEDFGPGDDALGRYVAAMAGLPQLAPLGAFFGYNNAGWSLAGRVIEAATGQTYEAATAELVLGPLGMERSFFFAADAITHAVAVGHAAANGETGVVRPWPIPRGNNPAGGVIASTRDTLRYARFHLGDGTGAGGRRVLSAASVARMRTPLGPGSSELGGVGVGWLLRTVGGARVVEHGGATNGQQSTFLLVPERGFAFVLNTNADAGAELGTTLAAWALDHYLGLRDPESTPLERPAAELAPYAGDYADPGGTALRVSVRDGALVVRPLADGRPAPGEEDVPLAFLGEDAVVVAAGPAEGLRGDFLRRPDGTVDWFRVGGRLLPRAD